MKEKVYAELYDSFVKNGNSPKNKELPLVRKSLMGGTWNTLIGIFALLMIFGWISGGSEGSSASNANKSNPVPCNFLSDINLATRPWNEQLRTCSSNYLDIDPDRVGSSGLPNNIAYYYQHGKALIVLNMNNPNNIVNPFAKFKEAANTLSMKATGIELPMEMRKAIYKHSQMPVGMDNEKYMWRLKRIDWGNGGYELQFAIIGNMAD